MQVVQSTYSENINLAVEGMLADGDNSVNTYIVETTAGIGFGLAVSQGTNDNQVLLGSTAANIFLGVSVRDHTVVDGQDKYKDGANIAVCYRGEIWVKVESTVANGGDVTFNSTSGKLSSAATSGTQFSVAGARWRTSASTNGLALLQLSGELPSA